MTSIQSILIPAFMLLTPAAPADTATVFRLAVQEQGEEVAAGVGVLMADELLLTSYSLIAHGNQYLVHDSATEARLAATVKAIDVDSSMALLAVPGLNGDPATVALEASGEGRRVHLLLPEGTRREGILHSTFEGQDEKVRYRFTVIVEENEIAAPLMNNCAELLAISQGNLSNPVVGDANLGVSGALPELVAFLNAQNVAFQIPGEVCLSLQEQLQQAEKTGQELEQERQRLEEEKAALEEELDQIEAASNEEQQQSQEQVQELEARKAALEERLRKQGEELSKRELALAEQARLQQDIEEQVEKHESESQRKDEEFARQQGEQAEAHRLQRSIGVGIGILLLIAIMLMLLRLRARQRRLRESTQELAIAQSNLERSNATFPDVVLVGTGPEKQELRIKINGNALARSESGQVVGRSSADADYVIGVDSISRKHACLRVESEIMTIEDLNSLNGTRLDGVNLNPGEAHAIRNGALLTLGDVDFVAHFLSRQ